MSVSQDASVQAQIVVDAPIERAFAVFTDDIGSWFPSEYNLLETEIAERVFEPREGGHVYDRGTDGSECHWARVLSYEPPNRVVISWDIGPQWQIETDPEKTSEGNRERHRRTAQQERTFACDDRGRLRRARDRQAARAARRPSAGGEGDAREHAGPEGTPRERRVAPRCFH
jgi:uncharacterized protein YndB with AHSA1/START domain